MKKTSKSAEHVIDFLKRREIDIPENFGDMLLENAQRNYQGKLPSIESVEAVVKACVPWKPYVTDEIEYSKLVCRKIISMADIHTATISSNKQSNAYIGNVCRIKTGKIPEYMSTTATYEGKAFIRKDFGSEQKELL